MQATELLKYIKQPQLLKEEDLPRLQQLTRDFPYFQSAHLLLSMASKRWNASVFQQSLKKTAIVVSNRSYLYQLVQEVEKYDTKVVETETALPVEKPKMALDESIKQELDILKSAEVSVEDYKQSGIKPETHPKEDVKEDVSFLEKEIGLQTVNAIVEKDILRVTEEPEIPETPEKAPESFTAWLDFLKKSSTTTGQKQAPQAKPSEKEENPADKTSKKMPLKLNEEQLSSKKLKQKAIIDKIIETSPGLIRAKEDQKFYTPEHKAKESLLENEHLVTETLAKIYALQGNIAKAVRSYEILSLKYPQKSAYFASLIKKLKNNH